MPEFTLRKTLLFVEQIEHEGGPPPAVPRQRAALLALVKNPFAGIWQADLQAAMEDLKPLGLMMTDQLITALGGIEGIDSYGKAALAGGRRAGAYRPLACAGRLWRRTRAAGRGKGDYCPQP